jgi:hypothetical protein
MAGEQKRLCKICDTEHKVGEACPNCGWHHEKEEAKIKAEIERESMRKGLSEKQTPKKKGFFD